MPVKKGMEGMYIEGMIPALNKYKNNIDKFIFENQMKLMNLQEEIYSCVEGSQAGSMDSYFESMNNSIKSFSEDAMGPESTVVTALDEAMNALKEGDQESKILYEEYSNQYNDLIG